MKYRENPQSTSSAMEFIGNLPLPAITICSKLYGGRKNYLDGVPFNETKLEACGLRFAKNCMRFYEMFSNVFFFKNQL